MAKPRPVIGLLSGVAAGLVASAAMNLFRKHATRAPVPAPDTKSDAVHYAVGAALGGMYGLLSEYQPDGGTGFGTAYGVATATVLDHVAPVQDGADATALAHGVVPHLVFGVVLEGVRTLLAGRR